VPLRRLQVPEGQAPADRAQLQLPQTAQTVRGELELISLRRFTCPLQGLKTQSVPKNKNCKYVI